MVDSVVPLEELVTEVASEVDDLDCFCVLELKLVLDEVETATELELA